MAPTTIDLKALSDSICDGIVKGTAGVISEFSRGADSRHKLANDVQVSMNKVYELDKEMVLVKGMLVALIGKDADGSSGLVPRMDSDMKELKTDVTTIKGEMREMKEDFGAMAANIKTILAAQSKQTSWTDGWRGVGFAVVFGATCVTVIGGVVAGLLWLYQHGTAISQHTSSMF